MNVFGVDCGKDRVHMVGEGLSMCVSKVKPGTPRDVSLHTMAQDLSSYLTEYTEDDPERVRLYVEAPVLAGRMNIQATIGIAETVGMVLSLGYPATLVPVSTWKKAVVGNGNATKEDVEAWYRSTGGTLKGQDFYDAAAICAYGVKDMDIAGRLRRGLLRPEG